MNGIRRPISQFLPLRLTAGQGCARLHCVSISSTIADAPEVFTSSLPLFLPPSHSIPPSLPPSLYNSHLMTQEFDKVNGVYRITPEVMAEAKASAVLMHPLPRVGEIAEDCDVDPRAAYFRQMQVRCCRRLFSMAARADSILYQFHRQDGHRCFLLSLFYTSLSCSIYRCRFLWRSCSIIVLFCWCFIVVLSLLYLSLVCLDVFCMPLSYPSLFYLTLCCSAIVLLYRCSKLILSLCYREDGCI